MQVAETVPGGPLPKAQALHAVDCVGHAAAAEGPDLGGDGGGDIPLIEVSARGMSLSVQTRVDVAADYRDGFTSTFGPAHLVQTLCRCTSYRGSLH